jgi:single-strand DNA-binding protein
MATRSWNRVELIGNLTRDPEMRYTPQGTAVATFSIATNRVYTTPDGEKKEEADFHRCVAWGKLAELCSQLLKKGNRVFVSGRLQNRSWESQDGQQKNSTEIVIEDMLVLTSRGGGESDFSASEDVTPQRSAPKAAPKKEEPIEDVAPEPEAPKPEKEEVGDLDDLPF